MNKNNPKNSSKNNPQNNPKKSSKDDSKNFVAGIATGAGTVGVASGVALKSAGFYTLSHSVTAATMLASSLGGASGAGTVCIIGGTAGVIGTGAAILMSPLFIGAAGTAAVMGVGYSAYQHLKKKDNTEDEEDEDQP